MNVLHTSDWHLGRTLYGQKRHEEFRRFLDWMIETIVQRQVDLLLIAGDVFDSSTPGIGAQELYYKFLGRVAGSPCRHVVVIAGNHDSPTFLNAPRELLRALNVHVVGAATGKFEDEVFLLKKKDGTPEAIVCAVPYLRDRDLRVSEEGETMEEKNRKLLDGVRDHYAGVVDCAQRMREATGKEIPLIATGHLFTAGGTTVGDDGVRELYVGTLARVPESLFPGSIDYLALGHLHVPQKVDESETRRFGGSPLPMGFGEAHQRKSVCLIHFADREAKVELVEVPVFQRLERVKGNWDAIAARIAALASSSAAIWLEVVYEGNELVGDLRERLEKAVSGTGLTILRVKNNRLTEQLLTQQSVDETLDDLSVEDIFDRCLSACEVDEAQRPQLRGTFQEILRTLEREDAHE
ncbi:MAG: exonuclease SbcCD subunit D C-terminal domain-containing protein [Chitinispirillaceae bacterium]|nr:exonuclease SbcCD subunit D C-terminal domain-containing protein [Chitinispirillaceae bacterium]